MEMAGVSLESFSSTKETDSLCCITLCTYHCVLVALTLRFAPAAKGRILFACYVEGPVVLLVLHQLLKTILPLHRVDAPELEFESDTVEVVHPLWRQQSALRQVRNDIVRVGIWVLLDRFRLLVSIHRPDVHDEPCQI